VLGGLLAAGPVCRAFVVGNVVVCMISVLLYSTLFSIGAGVGRPGVGAGAGVGTDASHTFRQPAYDENKPGEYKAAGSPCRPVVVGAVLLVAAAVAPSASAAAFMSCWLLSWWSALGASAV
jgi:hypothetical protein